MATTSGLSIRHAQIPVRPKGNNRCPSHKDNDVIILCRDCNMLICRHCVIGSHKSHKDSFLDISKAKSYYQNPVKDFVTDTDMIKIPKLKKAIASAKKEKSSCEPKYKILCEKIRKERDRCKLVFDKMAENYFKACDKMEMAATDLLQAHIKNLEERLDSLGRLSSEYKQTLQTGTAVLMYDSVFEIRQMGEDIPQMPFFDVTEFIPSMNIKRYLKQEKTTIKTPTDRLEPRSSFGENQNPATGQSSSGSAQYKLRDSPTVIAMFPYSEPISSICLSPLGRAWVCDYETNLINLTNNKGQVIETVHHCSKISNISLDPNQGRLWFCCGDERTIYNVSASFKAVRRFTTEAEPVALCVTMEGRVVVGTWGIQGYKVVMYTANGRVLHTAIVERSGMGYVLSITQCGVTGNIAVVGSKFIGGDGSDPDNFRRHIIVYNPTLQPLVHYRGEGLQTQGEGLQAREGIIPEKFDPCRVVYDSKGNIVIADGTRNTIELISGAGQFIKTLHKNKWRQGPVGIQKDDVVWIYSVLNSQERGFRLLKYYSD
ncbi:uncharacterized protein LOC117336722 [Pecten maximus]|uniref:uncharacterized protein LOC117336722 n=1 Tax=Pecten maximus TaxID=6579 RepID=UPI001458EBD8|nr:uncharacterized protein LOC117336722 [Pecten maximus]